MRDFYVYILSTPTQTLYVGVTNDIERRVSEHKLGLNKGFTSKYNIKKLVYYEHFRSVRQAIRREKELKGWRRSKKIKLIEEENPYFLDLSNDWY